MTPLNILKDMVNMLPTRIWKNKDIKILDPSGGDGRFSIYCYELLMKNLTSISNKTTRSIHIIENMLYVCELNKQNVKRITNILYKIEPNSKPNIYNVDYLKWNSTINYDIILGNVPYNNSGGVGRVGSGSKQPIWPRFIDKSLSLLNPRGYINFIHPTGWRKYYTPDGNDNIGHVLYNYNENGSILKLKITDEKINEHFPPVDYYLYQHGIIKPTQIESTFKSKKYQHKIDIHKHKFIPSIVNNESTSILTKIFEKTNSKLNMKLNIKYHGWMQPNKSMLNKSKQKNDIPYAFYYDDKINNYQIIYENTYSKIKNDKSIKDKSKRLKRLKYVNPGKIIMTYHGSKRIGDLNAKYITGPIGSATYTMYIIPSIKYDKNMLVNFLNSKLIKFILKLTQYSPPPRNKNEWIILNQIDIPNLSRNVSDNDIYKYYNLTKAEIDLIEDVITPVKKPKQQKGEAVEKAQLRTKRHHKRPRRVIRTTKKHRIKSKRK